MPPRIPSSCCQPQLLLNSLETAPSSSLSPSPLALQRLAAAAATASTPSHSSPQCRGGSRAFSTTAARPATRLRRQFLQWTRANADKFRQPPQPGKTNYISQLMTVSDFETVGANQPFPNNPSFRSEPVLSEEARELIWRSVMEKGMPLKAVSAQFQVDMRRVAAVVRMKEIEKKWERENKPMATPYAKAILSMLPRAKLEPGEKAFEPINDIHVHSYTMQQLFVPTSESREFTRADAARAFGEHILPPDAKMRIPELVDMERNLAGGMEPAQAYRAFMEAAARSEADVAAAQRARRQRDDERTARVDVGRFEYRFEKINAEDVGRNGRSRKAVGWRYGVPFSDRRRGEVKIPTKVE
ncbi:37S ribosomal protein S35, mitochondrial [Madurella fahalii]|uniref:37S ribosomal protein S35, mitochondrial n=1 Tax=Madurella fahalii TaxID=1157608 RepID=A0ABQ0G3N2_9PEZI